MIRKGPNPWLPPNTEEERQWQAAWEAKIRASYGKSQRTQDRVSAQYHAEYNARALARVHATVRDEAEKERAWHNDRMREYRARKKAERLAAKEAAP